MKKAIIWLLAIMIVFTGIYLGITEPTRPTLEEKKAEFREFYSELKEERKAEVTGFLKEALIEVKSELTIKYDKDYELVSLVGTDLEFLKRGQRVVLVEGFKDDRLIFSQTALGYIYSQDDVVVPATLFYQMTFFGLKSLLDIKGVSIKTTLSPNEELGAIKLIRPPQELNLAVIARVDPIIDAGPQYTLGKFEDLSAGDVLYRISSYRDHLLINQTDVTGVFTFQKTNLIDYQGAIRPGALGGLLFAFRNGEPELVGITCVILETTTEEGYVMALDINQVIKIIETEIK